MSADRKLRVVHYLNQFFGGIGGEDKANSEPVLREGVVGPGQALQKALGERGEVVATTICGDNYFAENIEETSRKIVGLVRPYHPDILIAGPAFDAGRYGVACGAVCRAIQEELKIPAITAMYPENPGVDLYHREIYIVETGNSVMSMGQAIARLVKLAVKLVEKQEIGKPAEEGYIPRGIIVNEPAERPGAERVVTMLLRKLKGEPFESEVSLPRYDRIPPAPAVTGISSATIALVTDGGLMPRGNPDKIESSGATKFGRYDIKGSDALNAADYDVYHSGYDPVFIRQDPNRLVPVDVLRLLEKERLIGRLHARFFATTGVATTMENARRIGREIAAELHSSNIDGVILTST
jgi:betaine reductase